MSRRFLGWVLDITRLMVESVIKSVPSKSCALFSQTSRRNPASLKIASFTGWLKAAT